MVNIRHPVCELLNPINIYLYIYIYIEADKSVSLQRCNAFFAAALLCWQKYICSRVILLYGIDNCHLQEKYQRCSKIWIVYTFASRAALQQKMRCSAASWHFCLPLSLSIYIYIYIYIYILHPAAVKAPLTRGFGVYSRSIIVRPTATYR